MRYSTTLVALSLTSFTAVLLLPEDAGGVLDFFLLPNKTNSSDGERQCRERGYDGLAALSTPEAYNQALEMSQDWRSIGMGIEVGLRYFPYNNSLLRWDDGNTPTPDTPWRNGNLKLKSHKTVGRIFYEGNLIFTDGTTRKIPICGNYGIREATFSLVTEAEPETFENATLGETLEPSYISCGIKCGLETRCRGAVFRSDVFTCKLFNTNLPLNITFRNNPQATMFVRARYPVYP
ncbi:hypothetical protein ElyMa_006268800 [Elysia marginata]|uniref:Apple domain-containing protein n=1 Tax=Elysia marginata TaxID=1093978 RepID=A0AAV4HAP2_9GAST|nr:hypothetical protein ElyMa_006268800 [Elysia marginata]